MDDNPYQSPTTVGKIPAKPTPDAWHPLTWAVVGFAVGVNFVGPLILIVAEPITYKVGGLLLAGIVGAILGLAYGIKRRW